MLISYQSATWTDSGSQENREMEQMQDEKYLGICVLWDSYKET